MLSRREKISSLPGDQQYSKILEHSGLLKGHPSSQSHTTRERGRRLVGQRQWASPLSSARSSRHSRPACSPVRTSQFAVHTPPCKSERLRSNGLCPSKFSRTTSSRSYSSSFVSINSDGGLPSRSFQAHIAERVRRVCRRIACFRHVSSSRPAPSHLPKETIRRMAQPLRANGGKEWRYSCGN